MKKLIILLGMMAIMIAVFAATGLADPPGGPGGASCGPWDWDWYGGPGHWYWQFSQWCQTPWGDWYQNWGGWGWS